MGTLESNVFNTAPIFERGGIRASHTTAIANSLLEEGVYFNHVYEVSAGSSNAVNYLAHPAQIMVSAFERDTGRSLFWTKDDTNTLDALMQQVRVSSTLPLVMPPIEIRRWYCYDGGLAEGNGLLAPQIRRDGFDRFFIIRTRPKSFRKPEKTNRALHAFFRRSPALRKAPATWRTDYNAMCDAIDKLIDEGKACVVYAEHMIAKNNTKDASVLEKNYIMDMAQADRDMPSWKRF